MPELQEGPTPEPQKESTPSTEKSRDALYVDHPFVHTVYIDRLLDAIFPRKPSDEIWQALLADVFPTLDALPSPADTPGGDAAVFGALLLPIVELVESCLRKFDSRFRPSVVLHVAEAKIPGSDIFGAQKPDFFYMLGDHLWTTEEAQESLFSVGEEKDYMQMASLGEVKKRNEPELDRDNIRKVVWSMHHVLRNDLRRSSTIGWTVANDVVRVAYLDRSNIVVSQEFSIRSHQFLRILASFATATREELGYDDTVKFVEFKVNNGKKSDSRIWDYLVYDEEGSPRVFRTIRRIADNGVDALTGRGNRVWEVRELVGGGSLKGPSLALKDAWLDHDRLPEYKTLRDIDKSLGDDPRRRHLLKVEHAGQVRRSDGKGDTTNAAVCDLERFQPIHLREDLVLKQNVESGSRNSLTSLPDKSTYSQSLQPEIYHGKSWSLRRHDRMVSEFGDVFSGMTRYDTVFYTLHGALCALSAFHDAGWIHRDVSPYNILLVKRVPGDPCSCNHSDCRRSIDDTELVAVLMDVEFALRISSDDPRHAVPSGTLDFMSRDVITKSWDTSLLPPSRYRGFPHDTLLFRQNTFDDVQAFLWILVWTLLYSFLGGSLAHQSSPDRFRKAYNAIATFYNNVSTQIPLCWVCAAEFVQLLKKALPDAPYDSFIGLTYNFHLQLRQQHSIAFAAAYSAKTVTVDVTTLAHHTPSAITAGMETMRELLRVALGNDELAQTEFNLKKAARRPSVKEWKQLPTLM